MVFSTRAVQIQLYVNKHHCRMVTVRVKFKWTELIRLETPQFLGLSGGCHCCSAFWLCHRLRSRLNIFLLRVYYQEPKRVLLSTEGSTWNQKGVSYGESQRTLLEPFFVRVCGIIVLTFYFMLSFYKLLDYKTTAIHLPGVEMPYYIIYLGVWWTFLWSKWHKMAG